MHFGQCGLSLSPGRTGSAMCCCTGVGSGNFPALASKRGKIVKKFALILAASGLFLAPQMASAQDTQERVVTVMHAAPGKYYELVQWLAQTDRIRAEAKLAPRQIYRHRNGANWDFLVIEPPLVADEDDRMEAAAKKLEIKPDPGAFRRIVMDHEDTVVGGPTTGTAILESMQQ